MSKAEGTMESCAVTRACICIKLKFLFMDRCVLNVYLVVLGVGRK